MHRSLSLLPLLVAMPTAFAQPLPPLPDLERPPAAVAEESDQQPQAAPEESPAGEPPVAGEETIEPEVTITRRGEAVVQEFRLNGRLYMIRVLPTIGYPYYLVDTNADGVWDTRLNDLAPIAPPQWVLFSW
jgi:hypothetical protein